MDAGTILGFIFGYFATLAGVFLLYLPIVVLIVVLLLAAGVLQLLLLPFIVLMHKLRRSKPKPDIDGAWLLAPAEG
jgi:uncharacterized membrane protein (Fun14 family)